MEEYKIKKFGASCGKHGACTFYKAFKYKRNGENKIIGLGHFFFVKILDGVPVCIGELQLVWEDKNCSQDLASVRLYFLPECTPEGRLTSHGEDEVLAYSEKIVLKLDDLASLIVHDVTWSDGRRGFEPNKLLAHPDHEELTETFKLNSFGLDTKDVDKEREHLNCKSREGDCSPEIRVLSYDRYCRYRAVLRRLEGCTEKWLRNAIITAIGGFTMRTENNRIYFCRNLFDHPDLDDFELRCDHLAPNLRGRPRKKKRKGENGNDSSEESSCSSSFSSQQEATVNKIRTGARATPLRNGFRIDKIKVSTDEQAFLIELHKFMKGRGTPIGRIPSLGFKQIDLYQFYSLAEEIGGYEQISQKRMWKHLYDKLGGNPGFTSAATCTRRHFEKLLLPYEKYKDGKDIKLIHKKRKHKYPVMEDGLKHLMDNKAIRNGKDHKIKLEEKVGIPGNDHKIKMGEKVKEEISIVNENLPPKSDNKIDVKRETPTDETEQRGEVTPEAITSELILQNKLSPHKLTPPKLAVSNENVDMKKRALIIKQEIETMKMRKNVDMKKRALIIKQEIETMKMRKDAQKLSESDSDRERVREDQKKAKLGDKVRKPSGGQKTVRELLDRNGKEGGDMCLDRAAEKCQDVKPVTADGQRDQKPKSDLDKDKSANKPMDLNFSHIMSGAANLNDPKLPAHALMSPLSAPCTPMFYPQLFPMTSPVPGMAPMAMPFIFPGFGVPVVTSASPVSSAASISLERKSNHVMSKHTAESRHGPSNTQYKLEKSAISHMNMKPVKSSNIAASNPLPPPSNHAQPPQGPLTTPQSNSTNRPIKPAHSNNVKRHYPYTETNRNTPSYGTNNSGGIPKHSRANSASDVDLKRHKRIGSPDAGYQTGSTQFDIPVLDLSMKTLRAQEARHQRGESLLFNTSFQKDANKTSSKSSYDAPQDLSLKSSSSSSSTLSSNSHSSLDLSRHASSSGLNVHRSTPLSAHSHRKESKVPNGGIVSKGGHPGKDLDSKPDFSAAFKIPAMSGAGTGPTIGGLPIDPLGAFVHPAFPQQMLMPGTGVFPTPLQLQQMIQSQVVSGMPMLRPDFMPPSLMFPPHFPSGLIPASSSSATKSSSSSVTPGKI